MLLGSHAGGEQGAGSGVGTHPGDCHQDLGGDACRGGLNFLIALNLIRHKLLLTQKFKLLASLELPDKLSLCCGGWVVEGDVSVLPWFKTEVLFLDLDLDQAEQSS